MKYELNRSYNGGGVVYLLKARHLDQHDSILLLNHYKSNFAHISDSYISFIEMYLFEISAKNNKKGMTRKEGTRYGSFLHNLEIGQKLNKKNPFTDVIFRFQSTAHYNWRGKHICQRGDITS